MLIAFVCFLAFLASSSSEIALPYQGIESPLSRMRRQSGTEHTYYVGFSQNSNFHFGLESYCTMPSNRTEVDGHQYNIEDCVQLIDFLAGEDHYNDFWMVEDYDCSTMGDCWWMTVAGWGTCNFAIVAPACEPLSIA
ncbi:hypothetical protein INS49_009467 [Diaporthe citri]|uniref:uncharacterized protein n=1 Tax=Diaporthe citri TaxID=83186 RepID=UPI001C80B0FE|nr:uncharacterized protein INS49_009467 [Diaporthe citri]KAG6361243.1 hypothetical protein INS49_009467 [Diaporthe citri]